MAPLPASTRRRWLIILLLAPWLLYALPSLYVGLESLWRWDRAYFTPELVARYAKPEVAFDDLVVALRTGNADAYSRVLGQRWSGTLTPQPDLKLTPTGADQVDGYWHFYQPGVFDAYFEQVNGRWVYALPDLRFSVYTGEFLREVLGGALFYYAILGAMALISWLRLQRKMQTSTRPGTPR